MVINWPGLNDKEKAELIPTLSITDNWILLTHLQGASNKSQPPFGESQRMARANNKCSRHKGWWREGKDELATHSMTIQKYGSVQEAGFQRLPGWPYRKPRKRNVKNLGRKKREFTTKGH